ncbi:MAG: hypothetical protein ISR96_01135 [Nitrospira sp.]|nr:hypothetical protein [Nitrospira sp.]
MGYTNVALKDRIFEMYPDLIKTGVSVGLDFSDEKKAYRITLKSERQELDTYIDQKDADECMDGKKCLHLGVKIGEFMDNVRH